MPQTSHQQRAVELHKLAAHAHLEAATSHDKGDHLTAHELTKQAHEHSRQALEHSNNMTTATAAEKGPKP